MAKKKISPDDNLGDMAELESMRRDELSSKMLFERWSQTDLSPIFTNPYSKETYMLGLISISHRTKRKEALKVAEQRRGTMRDAFYYIFEDITDEKVEALVVYCESSAIGAMCSLMAGADKDNLYNVTMQGRMYFVENLLSKQTVA